MNRMADTQTGAAYQVKDLAHAAQVTADAVRFYTRKGLLKPARNTANNYQLYSETDLIRLRFIRKAKLLGYTLSEIRQIITASEQKQTPCPMVREIIKQRIKNNRRKLDEAMALQKKMEAALKQWEHMDDAVPIGNSICHLIEEVT